MNPSRLDAFFAGTSTPDSSGKSSGRSLGFCAGQLRPGCLRIADDGTLRVGLAVPARDWLDLLPQLGETLQLAKNRCAMLGQMRPAPHCEDWRHPQLPRDGTGEFAVNLAEFARLQAARHTSPWGPAYSFEAEDVLGRPAFRVVLGAGSRQALYEDFVQRHQSPPEATRPWVPANHVANRSRQQLIGGRIGRLQARRAEGDSTVQPLAPTALEELLTLAAAVELPLRTTLFNAAVITTARWTPADPPAAEPGEPFRAMFSADGRTGLHYEPGAIASLWLVTCRCACCREEKVTLEIGDADHQLALTLAAAEHTAESAWRAVLKTLPRG